MAHPPLNVQKLAGVFGFTREELALNRAGTFSARQRQQLLFQSIGYLVRGLGVIILTFILALIVAGEIRHTWELAVLAVICLGMLVLSGVLFYGALRVIFPTMHHVSGTLARAGTERRPQIQAADRLLRINRRRWQHLPDTFSGEYRVYYGPDSTFLSAEPESEHN